MRCSGGMPLVMSTFVTLAELGEPCSLSAWASELELLDDELLDDDGMQRDCITSVSATRAVNMATILAKATSNPYTTKVQQAPDQTTGQVTRRKRTSSIDPPIATLRAGWLNHSQYAYKRATTHGAHKTTVMLRTSL